MKPLDATLENPLRQQPGAEAADYGASSESRYDQLRAQAAALKIKPRVSASPQALFRQHQKNRLTVWERLDHLADKPPMLFFNNWGRQLDGASLVTAVIEVAGREVAFYGHDFTLRAGSMDATNGNKLAALFELAGERGIPVIGLNDSAGAYVPAGVGGLDGYAAAFAGLRRLSGVVPSIMCMFGFNAGGGSYLPRQGSFVIQPKETFVGLTGAAVVQSVLGESITPDELGGPSVHLQTGVADYTTEDEVEALALVKTILSWIPDNNASAPPNVTSADPLDRPTPEIDQLLRAAVDSPTGLNTPIEVRLIIQQICDFGDYFEFQPSRASNSICAFGRIGGLVVGLCANNSAVGSGQIDLEAAYKNCRFIRFCNLYNIPMIFMEDTTGFLPGQSQEQRGIVQAGRAMLDAIVDLRTPRLLLIIRNAFGGAYASFNNYNTGADWVGALPTARVAVMGAAGKTFVYKKELKQLQAEYAEQAQRVGQGSVERESLEDWYAQAQQRLSDRYEREIMNANEALSLGSISQLVMPESLRTVLGERLHFYWRHYEPKPMSGSQREFF